MSLKATDIVDAIGDMIKQLPEGLQKPVWDRLQAAAQQVSEGRLAKEEFVMSLLPANLFTVEERVILEAKGALRPQSVN